MKLQVFNGGLNTRPRPQFIDITQAVVYENIDSDAGSLKPVKLPLDTKQKIGKFHTFYNAENEWIDSDNRRDYVEFQKTLYWTDRTTRPKKYDGTNEYFLGLDLPAKPIVAKEVFPKPINEVKLAVKSASAGLPADLQYYAIIVVPLDKEEQSNALHLGINDRDSVFTVAQATANPAIRPIVDNEIESKRTITFSDFKGIDFDNYTVEIYRQYQDTWRFVVEVTSDSSAIDSIEDISANKQLDFDLFGKLQGVYQYVLTNYNSSDGSESGPSELTTELDLSDGGIAKLSNISIPSDPQIDKVNVYRIGGNLTEFTLVERLEAGTQEFRDNVSDSDVQGSVLIDYAARPAPEGLAYLTTAYGMLFGALGSKLRFTPIGSPNDWPEEYFLNFEADITGIAPVANGILVFTQFRTHIVTGTGPISLSQYLLSGDQGCVAYESIGYLGSEALWVSEDGICASSGSLPRVLTKDLLGKIDLDPTWSTVYDEVYYVLSSDGSILALDRGIAKNFTLGVDSIIKANNKLYGAKNGTLHELFASTENAHFRYKSGKLTEGSFTDNKSYKKIFTFVEGCVKINIIINDEIVQTKEVEGKDSIYIQVPQQLQRGFYIQFEVEGTGEVSELEYRIGI